ncbi:hypothetical protein SLEP1_g28001 [Rubroshorea leprosula]|uniref:Transmembrane protein n=1 Tax=Rubroshorea leprosula TaxID=152421 RepID=A0AAV5K327_9ROSI|nr:hypothetical protein SLEP1_g28001 [Rubroshorea leprosula]
MHKSASWSRVSDDYFKGSVSGLRMSPMATATESNNHLPLYDNAIMDVPKKEKSRTKFAENAVHVIPFVLLVCALILWLFSNPDVEVGMRGDSMASRIEGLTIDGDIDNDSDGTQTGFLPLLDAGDVEESKQDSQDNRKLGKKLSLNAAVSQFR